MEPASKATPWKAYYDLLGAILQYGLTYFAPRSGAERPQLASEFRLVELKCESSFLREEKFPMAYVGSPNVEAWVEQVIRNWEILCGPQWCDEDFGAGGQDGVSRNVLDVSIRECGVITSKSLTILLLDLIPRCFKDLPLSQHPPTFIPRTFIAG